MSKKQGEIEAHKLSKAYKSRNLVEYDEGSDEEVIDEVDNNSSSEAKSSGSDEEYGDKSPDSSSEEAEEEMTEEDIRRYE
jgi:hypothetical protein